MTRSFLFGLLVAGSAMLAGCGGGGGSTGGGDGTTAPIPPTTSAALTFRPATATATLEAGKSSTLTINASVNRPSDFTGNVYALIADSTGVLLPTAKILSSSATEYSAVLQTAATLAPGSYKGNFTVNLCKDTACAAHWQGSPMQLPFDFQVVAAAAMLSATPAVPLNASVQIGGAAPAPVQVAVKGQSLNWTATASAPWIKLSSTSGSGDGSITVSYDTAGLIIEGTRRAEIIVSGPDGQKVVLPVVLTVLAGGSGNLGFSVNAVNGAPIPAIQWQLPDTVASWSAKTDAAWLSATPSSGTGAGQLSLAINPARGPLASGAHTGKLTLSVPEQNDRVVPVNLTLTPPTLTLSSNSLTLGGTYGRDATPAALTLGLNTQGNAWPWILSGVPAWAMPSATSGTVSETGSTVQFAPNVSALPAGTSSAVVNATVTVNGDTLVKPVTLTVNRDQRRLVPSDVGVALVSVPGWSRLSATIKVSDNFGLGASWTASSSQSWLTLSQNGDSLILNANPTGALNTVSYATVTLTPTTPGVTSPEVVRVALWQGSSAPLSEMRVKTSYERLVADPIRPLAYAHAGDGKIDVYNVYTGQRVASTAALGSALGDMAVSPNGDRLYVYDRGGSAIVVLDLATLSKQASWPVAGTVDRATRMKIIRPNGEELLLTSERGAYRVATGQRLETPFRTGVMSASADGRRVYVQSADSTTTTVAVYDVDFSVMGGGTLFAVLARTGGIGNGFSGNDIAISPDGTRLYSASATPPRCTVAKAADLSNLGILSGGDAWPSNVEVDSFGRVYCGSAAPFGSNDVWMHSATGTLLKTFRVAGTGKNLMARQMMVSGDGMILISVTDDPAIVFTAVGP